MKQIIIVFGVLAGIIVSFLMLINMTLWEKGIVNLDNGEYIGYTGMVIAFSMIFFGIKSYRDNQANGSITFGQGITIGLLITLIASLMYIVSWEIYYKTKPGIEETFMEQYKEHTIGKMQKEGAPPEEIENAVQELENMGEMYKNPFFRYGISFIEISPVGILISLISAALLRKKQFLPV